MQLIVTGTAGFIGFFIAKRLLEAGRSVIGIDNFNNYYDVSLKEARSRQLRDYKQFTELRIDLKNKDEVLTAFSKYQPEIVINLAAQAGVRYGFKDPYTYIDSNIYGFLNILEGCRHYPVKHLVYASTSSVYGANVKMPFSEHDPADHPLSIYSASKRANELMAHSYSHLFDIPCTGLRFFNVYGPWGRPDLALFSFTKNILEGKSIEVFNHGNMVRDFTYIDDIVTGVLKVAFEQYPTKIAQISVDPATSHVASYRLYNIGNNKPENLMRYIECIESELGINAKKIMLSIQPGEVQKTWADVTDLSTDTGYAPNTSIERGIKEFIKWYRQYYKV
ncbi:MAG: NAD-dependent epimerase/dehydratase family protein [Holosporales bacterium]|jgi:UDP-glucuronate 4-epimerase|nr:NAD-dependent epimerase/dehydratase family protein [Holosporales bacterium]